jgi:hypothetical protein
MTGFIPPRLRKPAGILLAGAAFAAAWLVRGGSLRPRRNRGGR